MESHTIFVSSTICIKEKQFAGVFPNQNPSDKQKTFPTIIFLISGDPIDWISPI